MVTEACGWGYGGFYDPDHIAQLTNMRGTYSVWKCSNFVADAGAPDFEKWCQSTGEFPRLINRGPSSSRYPAYRWVCESPSGSRQIGIPADQVCQEQYGKKVRVRLSDAYGTKVDDAWECFYYLP